MTIPEGGDPTPGVTLADTGGGGSGRFRRSRKAGHAHSHSAKRRTGSPDEPTARGAPPAPGADGGRVRRRRWPWVVGSVVVLLVGCGTAVAVHRIATPLTRPVPRSSTVGAVVVPGPSPALPWPAKGQGAVAVPSIHYTEQSGPESSVPIASLTKMTTAVVVLRDHPLSTDSDGPAITVTAADEAEYQNELHNDESTVAIQAGETLTERQMLEAMLTQSANDIAFSLATWDAGSEPPFVDKMNALAASLGATGTHYVDASGYDPQTVSTASDVLRVAAAGMAIPTFSQIVSMTTVTLPLVGTVHNIVSEVGTDGVIGIKSGYTSAAGACLVLAADRVIQGSQVLVLVAVLGQPTPPPTPPKSTTTTTTRPPSPTSTSTPAAAAPGATPAPSTPTGPATTTTTVPVSDLPIADPFKFAGPTTDALLAAARSAITPVTVATAHQVVGVVTATWGGVSHAAPVVTSVGGWLPGWPGQQVETMTRFVAVAPGSPAGTRVGARLFAIGSLFQVVPLHLGETVPEPSTWWRLIHA